MAAKLDLPTHPQWHLTAIENASRQRRGGTDEDHFVTRLTDTRRLELADTQELTERAPLVTRAAGGPPVILEAPAGGEDLYVLLIRHRSNAITFHLPIEDTARRAAGPKTIRFQVDLPDTDYESGTPRRGIVTRAIRTFLLKVAGKTADIVMPELARQWESTAWEGRGEGWKTVSASSLASGALPKVADPNLIGADSKNRNLLFLHGTFSNALDAFRKLVVTDSPVGQTLFEAIGPIYGDRVFAFDHFTVSKSPRENAQDLLNGLPDRTCVFDVVTHSRGGLVLRHLVELSQDLEHASRFRLGRAILVASPNEGTPLADPTRFEQFVGWIANVADMFPDNPLTEAVSFLAEALSWLAHRILDPLPGLAAMDPSGDEIRALSAAHQPTGASYSALVSNYEPDEGMLARLGDAGWSLYFRSANDLVVPTEGGWQLNANSPGTIPASQIGCYGTDGNITEPAKVAVSHVAFFQHPETVDFLIRALRGQDQPLDPVDPARKLPYSFSRGSTMRGVIGETRRTESPSHEVTLAQPSESSTSIAPTGWVRGSFTDEVFNVSILTDDQSVGNTTQKLESAILMATFRNARAIEKLDLANGTTGKAYTEIKQIHDRIRDYISGVAGVEMPSALELVKLGTDLFACLFPGDVRRLYDGARAEQSNRRINLILTSQIPSLATLPWEFVYDPARATFLATSEVNFTRNVVTAVPGERIQQRQPQDTLSILVVVAQPLGLPHLSVDEEKQVILSGFRSLINANLARIEVLLDSTPDLLHQMLEQTKFDVLHFIGHGTYDEASDKGYLLFEDDDGKRQDVVAGVLQQIICRRGIQLVFLNACETAEGGSTDFNSGVAPALVQAGVPAVVGNQFSVLDVSATAFARHFYWALARGETIGDAARESRVAVNYSISGEAIDWAVPVLFARDPTDQLCSKKKERDSLREAATENRRERRRSWRGRTRVALWDVQRIIPDLDQIAARLTAVQDKYSFEAVSIPAPLGTWRREATRDGAPCLVTDKVAERLAKKPRELGVSWLIAFTNFPMIDKDQSSGEEYRLYFWLGDDNKDGTRLALFSMADLLEQLNPPTLSVERMVANAVVDSLSEDVKMHSEGPRNCPSSYAGSPDGREIELYAGSHSFCQRCRVTMSQEDYETWEKLLRAY